jgi:CheY-like chemotaxis protein
MTSRFAPALFTESSLALFQQGFVLSSDASELPTFEESGFFQFQDEDADDGQMSINAKEPWILLIVDDEPQVHEATTLTLRNSQIGNRPFQFLHAHSAAEAREVIRAAPQIDLILLDVVMETRDAGLKLVTELRGPMGRNDLKILIRSGQPGFENASAVREHYPVDGYLQKTEQTHALMMEVIGSLLLGNTPDVHNAN